jgi:hypothetical protein
MKRLFLAGTTLAACAVASIAAAATTAKPADLPQSYLFTSAGQLTPLRAGVNYRASRFPLNLRLTPPNRGWSAAQWKSGDDYFQGGGPPNFGWVHIGHPGPTLAEPPLGLITIMTAYGRTPSVATTVNVLRTRGHGATYEATTPVKLAGFSGIQFDGQADGATQPSCACRHFFVPFSPRSHAAGYFADEYPVYGNAFRVVVLNVRGKTVVVFIENVALPVEQFPAFLTEADVILKSLRFPR